jgi:flagellar biosynthesis/type III secretory pathway ATPase
MVTRTRYENTCEVKQSTSNKAVVAEVMNFSEKKYLTVSLNRSVKLQMQWNGRVYEGHMAGMEFISDGPKISKYSEGR